MIPFPFEPFSWPDLLIGSFVTGYGLLSLIVLVAFATVRSSFVRTSGSLVNCTDSEQNTADSRSLGKGNRLIYSYVYLEKSYLSKKFFPESYIPGLTVRRSEKLVNTLDRKSALGREVTVWVLPWYPQVSVLDREVSPWLCVFCAACAVCWPLLQWL